MQRKRTIMLLTGLAIAVLLCVIGFSRVSDSQEAAAVAALEYADREQKVAQIEVMRKQPMSEGQMESPEINQRMMDAAAEAEMPTGGGQGLINIDPGQPQRVAGTDYREMSVPVRLEQVALKQVITFLHKLSTDDSTLRVKQIDLMAPREDDLSDKWNVNVTLAYMVYAPRTGREQ
jgi:hypothetical protein